MTLCIPSLKLCLSVGNYNMLNVSPSESKTPHQKEVSWETLNCIWWWVSSSGVLRNINYPFITIIPRSFRTRRGRTCCSSIYLVKDIYVKMIHIQWRYLKPNNVAQTNKYYYTEINLLKNIPVPLGRVQPHSPAPPQKKTQRNNNKNANMNLQWTWFPNLLA